ncbi:MAG: hypothetical protein AAF252_04015 [Pseudomonadota bacterium]
MFEALSSKTRRLLKMEPGFYVLRYMCDVDDGPIAAIERDPAGQSGHFDVIGQTRGAQVVLSAQSPMALIYVQGDEATIPLTLFKHAGQSEAKVHFNVERLNNVIPSHAAAAGASLVHLSGHVENIGDTEHAPGAWLGRQGGFERIEGFAVHWPDRPISVDLTYGCTVAGLGETPAALSGGFVGTRRRAGAITALWMDIQGSDAQAYNVSYRAYFSKSGLLEGAPGKTTSGVDDQDILVGLSVTVTQVQGKMPDPGPGPAPSPASSKGKRTVKRFQTAMPMTPQP